MVLGLRHLLMIGDLLELPGSAPIECYDIPMHLACVPGGLKFSPLNLELKSKGLPW